VGKILAVWAAAAVPMGILAWVVAPRFAESLDGPVPLVQALLILMTVGLAWQFVLVLILVWREQGSLRWSVLREALWLKSPRSPRSGRVGGRVWLVLIPLAALFWAEGFIPTFPHPAGRDFGMFLGSPAGEAFFNGAWEWFALAVALWVFNTVLGEELLFRGFLLPRMNGVFGRFDWLVNGVLFAAYHVHVPWVVLTPLADAVTLAYPTKRFRSAWIGIAVHSAQSVFLAVIVLGLVL
jgi:membrane protease YdiL (CAAX protease family)